MNKKLENPQIAIKGLQGNDVIFLYNYLCIYEVSVKDFAGMFDINDKNVKKYLEKNDIFLTTMSKKNMSKAKKHKLCIRFEQYKRSKVSGQDIAHHLLRHIRNSIAHVRIEKSTEGLYRLTDHNGKIETMETKLPEKILMRLIEVLLKSKHK